MKVSKVAVPASLHSFYGDDGVAQTGEWVVGSLAIMCVAGSLLWDPWRQAQTGERGIRSTGECGIRSTAVG